MPKKQTKPKRLQVGDVIAVTWDDTVAYGRTTQADEDLILAEFTSYGIVTPRV